MKDNFKIIWNRMNIVTCQFEFDAKVKHVLYFCMFFFFISRNLNSRFATNKRFRFCVNFAWSPTARTPVCTTNSVRTPNGAYLYILQRVLVHIYIHSKFSTLPCQSNYCENSLGDHTARLANATVFGHSVSLYFVCSCVSLTVCS